MRRAAVALGLTIIAQSARAADREDAGADPPPEEPIVANEPFVLHEPGSVVDVLDAADGRDPFDIEISLGFAFSARWATIARTDAAGAIVERAAFRETTSLLVPHVEVGLYHDFSFVADLPVALSRDHSITRTEGSIIQPMTIFSPGFTGESRSGPLHLALGLQADVFNQTRKPKFPTWLVGAGVRVPLGEPIHACNGAPLVGQVRCADPADVNRNGASDVGEPSGLEELGTGTSSGALGIDVRTVVSRRLGYVEPYGGVKGSIEVPVGSSDLARVVDAGAAFPPIVIEASVGALIIPFENRERFGRVSFDVRASVDAHTEGTDASPLFDALGSSAAPSIRETPAGALPFSGFTRVEAFPTGRLSTEAIWQTSQYVRLSFATAVAYDGNHDLTLEDPTLATSRPSFASGKAGYSSNEAFTLSIAARGAVTF
ncbi:MAG: hypothetical protein U0414_00515 [Polyangiaceae bacterium]